MLAQYVDTALFIFSTPQRGYLWIFPKADHLSVGISAFQERVPDVRRILRQEMARLGVEIDGARQRSHFAFSISR